MSSNHFFKVEEETLTGFNERQQTFAKKRINDALFDMEMGDETLRQGGRVTYQQQVPQHIYPQMPYFPTHPY